MPTYVFFADKSNKRRPDGVNTVCAQGANEAAARAVAESLIGQPGAFSEYAAVDVSAAAPPFVVQGHPPVGAVSQSTWPMLTRGGDPLRGA